MAEYGSGKFAWAICDICGLRCRYSELRALVRNRRQTQVRVCPDCRDRDQPSPRVLRDPQALRHPRPEEWDSSRHIRGWWPVDSFEVAIVMGIVEVDV
ncbi:MAG: hypothetical protein ABWY12_09770 [Burkholderiales bacterium]